ncbi:MAG: hypothetical protein RMK65_03150, partial [Anaerolineae bacterium]|nr:hypothetical protein [Anaerolineae bacterium]
PGRIYKDDYTFRVWPTAPPGEYRLEVGWWDPETEARYPPRILAGKMWPFRSELTADIQSCRCTLTEGGLKFGPFRGVVGKYSETAYRRVYVKKRRGI